MGTIVLLHELQERRMLRRLRTNRDVWESGMYIALEEYPSFRCGVVIACTDASALVLDLLDPHHRVHGIPLTITPTRLRGCEILGDFTGLRCCITTRSGAVEEGVVEKTTHNKHGIVNGLVVRIRQELRQLWPTQVTVLGRNA